MDRRQFLQSSLGAALVGPLMTDVAHAQVPPQPRAPAGSAPRKLVLDAYSRSLQWLRSADEVAEAAIEMVCGGVCPTVSPYPGHIDPARVAQEVPDGDGHVGREHGQSSAAIASTGVTRIASSAG